MKFKLPRQLISHDINKVISRELRKQKVYLARASNKILKEIVEVCKAISTTGLPKYLVCKKLSDKLGHGIFLRPDAAPILRGQVIAPYAGVVSIDAQNLPAKDAYVFAPLEYMHLSKEEQFFYDKESDYHPRRLYSVNLDAEKQGNFTRFINHSDQPNVIARILAIPSNSLGLAPAFMEVIYFANKRIHPGEQLLVCYEDEEGSYWDVFKIKPFPMTPKTFQLDKSLKLLNS